jgi:heptosyltransferase-2/heptosyltransferase-3
MNFLIIQFHQIGDVILTTPIARELKKRLPYSFIDFLTFKQNKRLLEYNPYIENIFMVDKNTSFFTFIKIVKKLNKRNIDAILDFQNNPRSLYFTLFTKSKYKVTYETSRRKRFYNTLVPRCGKYPSEIKMNLIAPFLKKESSENFDYRPEIFISENEKNYVNALFDQWKIKDNDFVVTISPTHKRITRRWPLAYYLELAHYLKNRYNAKIIFTWGPGEKEYLRDVDKNKFFVIPEIDILTCTALIGRAHLHIGNDSAPHHIATSQNVPTFIILGSSSAGWCYPSDKHRCIFAKLDCQPCKKNSCKFGNERLPCLKDLRFIDVKTSLDKLIADIL